MSNVTSYKSKKHQRITADYQQNIDLAMQDLQNAISILQESSETPDNQENLSQQITLIQGIITETVNRLQDLEKRTEAELQQDSIYSSEILKAS